MSRRARSRVVLAAVLFGGGLTSSAVATTPIAPRDVLVGPAPVAGFNAHAVRAAAARNWLALAGARSATQVVYRERSHAFLVRIVGTPTGARATALALRLRRLAGGRRERAIDRTALGLKRRATPPHPVVVKLAGGAVAELVIATEPRAAIRSQLTKMLRARAAALAAETPWTALLRRVARAGRVTPRTAEQAFAMALGPLPGVKVPAAGSTLVDGTIAVRWLNSVWSRVPARVRAAALKALRGPAPATTRDVDNFQPNLLYQQMAETAAVDIGSHLGQTLTLPMVAGFRSAKGIALGVTFGIDLQGNEVTVDDQGHVSAPLFACRIGITPKGQATFGPRLQETIYHEVFHCFQIQMAGVKKWFQDGHPWDWLYEGSAEWVGCDLVPAAGDAVGWYKEYLEDPGTTVLDRTYADMGYYAHLDEEGVPTWANWPSVFTQTKMQDALDGTIKGFDSQVFTTWAPGFLRAPGRGALWDAKAPCIPPDKAAPLLLPVYKGNPPNHVTVEQFANQLWQLTSNTGALGFAVEQGYGRLSSADGSTDEAVREDAICVKQGGCKCPDGLGNEIVLPQVTDPVLAVGAGRKQGEVAAVAIDIDKLCKEKAPPNPGGGGGGGGAGGGYSNGDPHMRTFDGQLYDFQAAGEFVLARSSDGTFEVQGRQETSGPIKTMTVNTAVAMRIGKHRVGIYLAVPPLVRLDGHKVNPTQKPIDLGGGARLRGGADGITVDRPDGTRVTVRNAGQWGLIAVVDPGAELRGRLQGLLGNFDGDSFNDLRVRGTGARVFANVFGQLYGRYRRSWLVTKRTSLFDYDHGRTTHSYDKPNIPTRPINVDGLTPAQRKKAQATCRAAGVHAEPFLSECVLDVGLTDKDDFATGTAGLQQTLTANAHRTTTTPWQKLTTIPLDSFSSLPIVTALGPNRAMVGWAQRTNPGVNPGLYALSTVDFDSSAATAVANPHPASVVSDWMEVDYGPAFWHPTPTTTAVIFAGGRNVDFNDPYFFKNVVSTHQDDGSWSTPVVVMPSDYPTPAAVGIDGGQPIFIRTVAGSGSLPLFHGINPAQTPFEAYDGGHYALWPVLTRDAAGTVWLAYRTPVSDAATGLYVRPFDAQTALPLGPSQMAPGSAQGADGAGPAPISCPPAGGPCRLVYESADRKSVLSWAPGDAAPVTVAQTNGAREVRGAYDASGRLWVLWKDDTLDGAYTVVHGDARGVGEPLTLDSPPTASGTLPDVGYTSILPLNGGLLVAANLGIDDVRSIYAAFVSG